MNIYTVSYRGPFGERSIEVQATNIHTAVSRVLAAAGPLPKPSGRPTLTNIRTHKPLAIRRGQSMTIRVTRII